MAFVHENTFLFFNVHSKMCLAYFWKFLSLLLCTAHLEFVFLFVCCVHDVLCPHGFHYCLIVPQTGMIVTFLER